jgi:hypothetical protein
VAHALNGCRLKMERAIRHVEVLNLAIERFREGTAHELVRRFDPETDETVWWIEGVTGDPPANWAPLIGDILHNFHSALDHVAWQLAIRKNYGHYLPPETRVTLPIFKRKGHFWRRDRNGRWTRQSGANALLRFPGDARKHVLAVQPYKDGTRSPEHPLWLLHALSNEDKHKTLHVVRSAIVDSDLQIKEFEDLRVEHFTPIQGPIRGPRTEIGRIKLVETGPNPKGEFQPAFAFGEAFGDGVQPFAGRYVGAVLDEITEYMINTVFRVHFGPYFEVDDWSDWQLLPGDPRNERAL